MLRNLCRGTYHQSTASQLLSPIRNSSTAASPSIFSVALIERRPVILPDPEPFELRFWALQDQIAQLKAVPIPEELLENVRKDKEKQADSSVTPFEAAPRRTAADEANDIRSLDRALDRTLYLMLQEDGQWKFPTEKLVDGDFLHTAAARAAEDTKCSVDFIARAPIGHLELSDGSKVFFHLSELLPTNKTLYDVSHLDKLHGDKYAWLLKEEVMECMDEKVLNFVLQK